ncbi:MAG: DUF4923 family protein [Prevotella sp.]|nr:DUF4923 family protein [Prevotella sp.]
MKRIYIIALLTCMLSATSCVKADNGLSVAPLQSDSTSSSSSKLGGIISNIASSATSKGTITNIVEDVIGKNKMTAETIVGTWNYKEPGVAFTSESLLATAGGEVAASTCKEKLATYYSQIGITETNTSFTFKDDGTFSALLLGKKCSGKYTFDEDNQAVTLKVLVLNITGYTKKDSDGMSLLFDESKILDLLQVVGKLSGSSLVSSITSLTSAYDGLQIGFDMSKAATTE